MQMEHLFTQVLNLLLLWLQKDATSTAELDMFDNKRPGYNVDNDFLRMPIFKQMQKLKFRTDIRYFIKWI